MNLTAEPFWCDRRQKYLKVISNREADRMCKDVQLYYSFAGAVTDLDEARNSWWQDSTPEEYMSGESDLPSQYFSCRYAVEVHLDKPELRP